MEDEESIRFKGYRLFKIDSTEVHLELTKKLIALLSDKKIRFLVRVQKNFS